MVEFDTENCRHSRQKWFLSTGNACSGRVIKFLGGSDGTGDPSIDAHLPPDEAAMSRVHLLFITSRICPNRGGGAPPNFATTQSSYVTARDRFNKSFWAGSISLKNALKKRDENDFFFAFLVFFIHGNSFFIAINIFSLDFRQIKFRFLFIQR